MYNGKNFESLCLGSRNLDTDNPRVELVKCSGEKTLSWGYRDDSFGQRFYVISNERNLCLDVPGGVQVSADGTVQQVQLQLHECNNFKAAQGFVVHYADWIPQLDGLIYTDFIPW